MDYSKFSDADLLALKAGDYSKVSNEGLLALKAGSGVSTPSPTPERPANRILGGIQQSLDAANQAPINAIPGAVMAGADKVMGKAGELIAEDMGKNQVNPNVAGAFGSLVASFPEAALMIDPLAKGAVKPSAQASNMAGRAAGLGKVFRKTAFGRKTAGAAGRTLLEQGLVPASGSPSKMETSIQEGLQKVGSSLGDMRGQAGAQSVDPILNSIEQSRAKILDGAKGNQGLYKIVNEKVDQIRDTILDLIDYSPAKPEQVVDTGLLNSSGKAIRKTIEAVPESKSPISLNRIVGAKKRLADTVNWFADNTSQRDVKELTIALERGISSAMDQAGSDMPKYRALKALYSSLKVASKGLDKEMAGLGGNSPISFRALVAGIPGGGGGLATQALKTGAVEAVRRRGAGVGANLLYTSERAVNQLTPRNMAYQAYDRYMARKRGAK